MRALLFIIAALVIAASAKTYFKEDFSAGWDKRWVQSNWKESDGTRGEWKWTAGKWFNDAEADKGIQTSPDARFYAISAETEEFDNQGKDLVLQFTVKHEQKIDCGGAYIKLLPAGVDQKSFSGDSNYNIMFGPDVCGSSTKRIHLIFNYKGKNHLWKKNVPCETDQLTHLYTLILHPDNTYEVQVDKKEVAKGNLKEDWDFLEAKEIKDPSAKKPADWVDEKEIPDPEDKKPEGYDNIPSHLPDPEAKKPEDWDDELDGEWEAPQIDNPEYKGEWKPKMIPNPAYRGEWVHPLIPNPNYVDDNNLYHFVSKFVGFELWQVKAGSIFDNIIVTDSVDEAKEFSANLEKTKEGEKKAFDAEEEKAREAAEAERKKAEAEKGDDDDDDEEKAHLKDEL